MNLTNPFGFRVLGLAVVMTLAGFLSQIATAQQPSSAEFLRKLRTGTVDEKIRAADQLGFIPRDSETIVPELITGLEHQDARVRWHCARALGNLGHTATKAIKPLRAALSDSDATVRQNAATAIGSIGDNSDDTVNALMSMIGQDDSAVARAAINALRKINVDLSRVVTSFSKLLESEDHSIVIHAMELLVDRGAKALPVIVEALKSDRGALWACIAVEEIGPDASSTVPGLTRVLDEHSDSQTRVHSLLALAAIGPNASVAGPQVIAHSKKTNNLTEKTAAAYALGSIDAKNANSVLNATLQSDDEFLSTVSSWALAKLNPRNADLTNEAVDRLVHALSSEKPELRMAAAKGLMELDAPPEKVAPALIAMAHDPNPSVVANVIDALASLGKPVAARAGRALANEELRDVALAVIERLGADAQDAIPDMIDALGGEDGEFKAKVQLALAEMGPNAKVATRALIKSLSSDDDRVRRSAMYALGRIGPDAEQAGDVLKSKFESGDDFDKMAICWAMLHIYPKNAEYMQQAASHLPTGLKHDDELVRLECVLTLGSLGTAGKPALEALKNAAQKDHSESVRDAAVDAINQIQSGG